MAGLANHTSDFIGGFFGETDANDEESWWQHSKILSDPGLIIVYPCQTLAEQDTQSNAMHNMHNMTYVQILKSMQNVQNMQCLQNEQNIQNMPNMRNVHIWPIYDIAYFDSFNLVKVRFIRKFNVWSFDIISHVSKH